MHVSYWCVLVAALLPFVFTAIAKTIGRREFSNRAPRVFQSKLTGMAARAHWAHLNSFEAFPPFAAGVLIAQQIGATQSRIDALAIAFVALRVVYGICYLADQATLRSLVWTAAFACTLGLFVIGA
ncbi:MAG: MAPEG family protein [Xanthomonadaceae bacterium]|nr:MAPEG family protein [Xanthomonadaceae bacterium]MDE1884524.1 MAPEG family protein [Xanthomonadaceae bacterium]MDE1960215.1 MAPEG family protein [Xanthomonadaceae bacterium]MDE2083808.1 MAPEG family protein [Xanthomonadaceae bacterium]MDE2258251.1 MAPEG family protein [Xanthomonadaceae bacterium]